MQLSSESPAPGPISSFTQTIRSGRGSSAADAEGLVQSQFRTPDDAQYAGPVNRAKQILQVIGICIALVGAMALPYPRVGPKASLSLFDRLAPLGAFTRPGLVLILLGVTCIAVAALLPSRRE